MSETKQAGKKTGPKKSESEKHVEALTADLKRVAADFENYRKRIERDQQQVRTFAVKEAVEAFVAPLDTFETALKHTDNHEQFVQGMWMIHEQFQRALESCGVEKVETEKFDPMLHEAVEYVEGSQQPDTIVEVVRSGYKVNGKVIRTAQVKVAKGAQNDKGK